MRRHYAPIDVVIARDAQGHIAPLRPGPGVTSEPGLVIYRFGAGIFYANAQRLSDELLELAAGPTRPRWIILEAGSIDDIDYTGGKTLGEIVAELQRARRRAWLSRMSVTRCARSSSRFGMTAGDAKIPVFETVEAALDAFHADSPAPPAA